jgi:hypothetical protein
VNTPTSSPHVATLLPAFAAGTLDPPDERAVRVHLAGCPLCRGELAEWRAIGAATRDVFGDPPGQHPDPLSTVWERVDAVPPATGSAPSPNRRRGRAHRGPAAFAPPRMTEHPLGAAATPARSVLDRVRRVPLPIATVLLVLVTLVVGAVGLGLGRPDRAGQAVFPVVSAPEGTPTAPAVEVVEIPLPESLLVRGDGLGFGLSHDEIPPASETVSNGGYLRIEHVLSGTVSVRSGGPTQVVRAAGDGSAEAVAAGTEVTLAPGDTLVAPRAAASTYRNAAPTPVELVTWGMAVTPESSSDQTAVGWVSHHFDLRSGSSLPPGPVRWRLRRVDLPPGAELAKPPGALHQFAVAVPGFGLTDRPTASVGRKGADTFVNSNPNPVTLYAVTLEPEPSATPVPQPAAAPGG